MRKSKTENQASKRARWEKHGQEEMSQRNELENYKVTSKNFKVEAR